LWNESFFSAPQLKRDSLGGAIRMNHHYIDDLLRLCPGAEPAWQQHLACWGGEERGTYNDLTVFAHHLVDTAAKGDFGPADRVFGFVESALESRNEEVEGLLVWGLLEDVQTISSHTPGLQHSLAHRLGQKSLDAWRTIADAWKGNRSLADVLRADARKKPS